MISRFRMLKFGNIQKLICLGILLSFVHHAWAEDWSYYDTTSSGDMYYDKSGVKEVGKDVISVRTKILLSENAKNTYFSILKNLNKAPESPAMLSCYISLMEIDYTTRKIRDVSVTFYDQKGDVIYSSLQSESGQWNPIEPHSVGEKLINRVSWEPLTSRKTVAAPGVDKAAPPKKASVAAPSDTGLNSDRLNNKKKEATDSQETAVRDLVARWLTSWQSGDMKIYRNCYTSDFESKGKNLDAWINHKTRVHTTGKKIKIQIDLLKISVRNNAATAKFVQHYSSSLVNDSGIKILELRKINDEWKIYRENMYQ